jgi:hypothetical protein
VLRTVSAIDDRPYYDPAATRTSNVAIDRAESSTRSAVSDQDLVVTDERNLIGEQLRAAESFRPHATEVEPVSEGGRSSASLADAIEGELAALAADVRSIGDRQRVFTDAKRAIERNAIPMIRDLIAVSRRAIALAESATDECDRAEYMAQAAAGLEAALILVNIERIEVSYLTVANAAEDAGHPSALTVGILAAMEKSLEPIVSAALSLDPERIAEAMKEHAPALEHAHEFLPKWAIRIDRGAELSAKAIAALDSAMIVLSAYQGARTIAGAASRGTPIAMGGAGVGATGALAAGRIAVSAEMLEALRQLIRMGAISNVLISSSASSVANLGPQATPEASQAKAHSAGDPRDVSETAEGSRAKSNAKVGRRDSEHGRFDAALDNAKKNAGDLGANTRKMHDPETGTLIGEQSLDGKRGWRIDHDHVNWWDWSGGKKGNGGAYGHEFFPKDQAGPHSKHIGYAEWTTE